MCILCSVAVNVYLQLAVLTIQAQKCMCVLYIRPCVVLASCFSLACVIFVWNLFKIHSKYVSLGPGVNLISNQKTSGKWQQNKSTDWDQTLFLTLFGCLITKVYYFIFYWKGKGLKMTFTVLSPYKCYFFLLFSFFFGGGGGVWVGLINFANDIHVHSCDSLLAST